MDPVTHALTGFTLARAGAARLGPYTTAALVLGAVLPELGAVAGLVSARAYVGQSAASHSLVGGFTLGSAAGALVWLVARRRGTSKPLRPARLLVASWLGGLSHLLLDWSSSRGVHWLWPVRATRSSLDWIAPTDLWLLVILLLGWGLPGLFRLIGEEIGAQRSRTGSRRGAWVALIACLLLTGSRGVLHDRATQQLASRLYQGRTPIREAAFALPLSPLRWHGVVETDTTFEVVDLDLAQERAPVADVTTYFKPENSPTLVSALATPSARAFLAWARFAQAEVVPAAEGGWRIRLQDLRSAGKGRSGWLVSAEILLNEKQEVVEEELRLGSAE